MAGAVGGLVLDGVCGVLYRSVMDGQKLRIALDLPGGELLRAEMGATWDVSSAWVRKLRERAWDIPREGRGRVAGGDDAAVRTATSGR